MKRILLFLILFVISGCKDDSIFVKKYNSLNKPIYLKTISFKTDNYYLLDKVERSFKKYGFVESGMGKYLIKLTSHYVISCKNPVVHALGADFSGYIRLSLFRNKKELYRIQKDFKSKVNNKMIDKIVKKLIKDTRLSPLR